MSHFSVVPVAYVVMLRDGAPGTTEVLLQLRRGTGYLDEHWAAAAAGHVDPGETAIDAAHREALEEIGVRDLALEFVTTMQRTVGERPVDQRVDFFFTSRTWSGEPRVVEPDKCGGLGWYPLDALPDPVVPHEKVVLDALCTGTMTAYTTFGYLEEHP